MGSKPSTARQGQNGKTTGGTVEFYWDPLSPPSRCVHMTFKALGEKFVAKQLDLFKGEHKTEEFLKINPAGKIPAIKDGDFTLGESRAIACYLCNKFNTPTSRKLYPTEPMLRAEVDRLLLISDDVMTGVQKQINLFGVLFKGEKPDEDKMEEAAKGLKMCSEYIGKKKWLTGDNVTIADFFVVMPFLLYEMATTDAVQDRFYNNEGGSVVKEWVQHVRELPYFDEVNKDGIGKLKQIYCSKLEN